MACPQGKPIATIRSPRPGNRRRPYSSDRPEDRNYSNVVYYREPWGLIYPVETDGRIYAVGGNTRVPCERWGQALKMCREWDRTGDCPVPRRFRITPRTKSA